MQHNQRKMITLRGLACVVISIGFPWSRLLRVRMIINAFRSDQERRSLELRKNENSKDPSILQVLVQVPRTADSKAGKSFLLPSKNPYATINREPCGARYNFLRATGLLVGQVNYIL